MSDRMKNARAASVRSLGSEPARGGARSVRPPLPDIVDITDITPAKMAPSEAALTQAMRSAVGHVPNASSVDVGAFLHEDVLPVLRRRQVSAEDLKLPEADILAPALDALRYSRLRKAYACLIATAMDRNRSRTVLPSYAEFLKQLSPDEFDLLSAIPRPGLASPCAHLSYVMPNGEVLYAYRYVISAALAFSCTIKSNIPQYMDNLFRLGLVCVLGGMSGSPSYFRPLLQQSFVQDLDRKAPGLARRSTDTFIIGITNLGEHFRRACGADL